MNEFSKPLFNPAATTRAAEGLPRYRWSVDQLDVLIEHGILSEDDRIELIGGELVPMSPKGNRHETVRDELQDYFTERIRKSYKVSGEIGWKPDPHTSLQPDIIVYERGNPAVTVAATVLLLLVEVAHSSLRFDIERKVKLYATLGVREYWVVNAMSLETTVHLKPEGEVYGEIATFAPDQKLVPHLVPELAVAMGELEIR